MPLQRVSVGPIDGHWAQNLNIIQFSQDCTSGTCILCVSCGVTVNRATVRTLRNVSNFYTHLKVMHADLYRSIRPIIKPKMKNKRLESNNMSMPESVYRSRRRKVGLFASPYVQNSFLSNQRFKCVLESCNPHVKIFTLEILNFRLWERFYHALNDI